MELRDIRGIGPRTEELFHRIGVYTTGDLIRYYPSGYDACGEAVPAGAVTVGAKCAVRCTLAQNAVLRRFGKGSVLTVEARDLTGAVRLTWFNSPFLAKMLKRGSELVFRGTVKEKNGRLYMDQPEIHTPERYREIENTLIPIYSLTKGLTGKTVAKAVKAALLADTDAGREYLPESMLHLLDLESERWAVRAIHFPDSAKEMLRARRRLVFDEFFLFVMGIRTLRARSAEEENHFPMTLSWDTEEVIASLPFALTGAQQRVWREIERDLAGKKLMERLVQGDVGSGKTVLAFLAMIMAASNGYQGALMAPTEVLARQHFEKLLAMKETHGLGFLHPVLLTGSLKAAERRDALEGLASGRYNAAVGTHALFQEGVSYSALGLVITDEQHRFGVNQREALGKKGAPPNRMVMSATPIPRTLGVIFYGDMDLSVLDELPARRLRIKNAVVDLTWQEKALHFIEEQVREGRQAYVICPMIEPDEETALSSVTEETKKLREELPDLAVGALHGRMSPEEKNDVMERFLSGEIRILVSTTVVEVGVDVPNATVMLILNAERFGLAQLHQLRGRVGRGEFQSYCIFMAGQKSEAIEQRLGILRDSNDGFEIAEKDFSLRGPGDLLGVRQSGESMFGIADVTRDGEILKLAGETAASVLADDPALILEEHRLLKEALDRYISLNERKIVL